MRKKIKSNYIKNKSNNCQLKFNKKMRKLNYKNRKFIHSININKNKLKNKKRQKYINFILHLFFNIYHQ